MFTMFKKNFKNKIENGGQVCLICLPCFTAFTMLYHAVKHAVKHVGRADCLVVKDLKWLGFRV